MPDDRLELLDRLIGLLIDRLPRDPWPQLHVKIPQPARETAPSLPEALLARIPRPAPDPQGEVEAAREQLR